MPIYLTNRTEFFILVNNKAEFKHALDDYFRYEKEPRNESHIIDFDI